LPTVQKEQKIGFSVTRTLHPAKCQPYNLAYGDTLQFINLCF